MEQLEIAPFTSLLSHTRFFLTLRSQEGRYHSLILFRLSPSESTVAAENKECHPATHQTHDQIYVMESSCPHLGADLSHAEIEECETTMVVVCPWHRRVQCSFAEILFFFLS
ncbi:hypothetical protein L208DRAFT_1415189 [Tricholoma matsutake]|nr:hypothetical protein L208DRAFT_1415189 [Tricholoma matsutake 945]